MPPGIDPAGLKRQVAIYHAEQIDVGLRQRTWASGDTTSNWTITYYEHGDFIARTHQPTANLTKPDEFRGFASTPLAAADLISQWFTAQFLARRAVLLNDTDPQLRLDPLLAVDALRNSEYHVVYLDSAYWVLTQLIVSTGR